MRPVYLWIIAALLYGAFFAWYTNLSGPLTDEEIESALSLMREADMPADRMALIEKFMREDTGDDFVMINLLDMNETPPDLPATGPDAEAGELMNHYMEYMYPALFSRACHPVFFGTSVSDALDLSGIEGAEHWETDALMRYRSRRDMLAISMNPAFNERHDYKMGALTKTIAFPVEPMINPADPRLLLALLMVAVTAVIHLIAFRR